MQHLLLLEFEKNALTRPDTNTFQGSFDDEKFGLLEKLTLGNNNRELSVTTHFHLLMRLLVVLKPFENHNLDR